VRLLTDSGLAADLVLYSPCKLACTEELHRPCPVSSYRVAKELIAFYPRPRNTTGVSLLSGEPAPLTAPASAPAGAGNDTTQREIISYLKPNVSIQLVDHFVTYPRSQIPPNVSAAAQ
jgi:hypothetical protein